LWKLHYTYKIGISQTSSSSFAIAHRYLLRDVMFRTIIVISSYHIISSYDIVDLKRQNQTSLS